MSRLLLSAVALAICLLTTSPIALARIVVSDVTFSACPGKEQLPLTTVDADVMVVSNSTVHIIGHMLSSINIDSAVCFINGTETAHGKTIVRGRVFDIQQLMITNEYLRIKAGSDLFIEAFTYFSMDMLPLRLESNLHVYDGSMQEINCELHGVTISYQEDDNDVVLNDTAALAARTIPAADQASALAASSTSSYTVSVNKWSNCRATDPVQVVDYSVHIAVNQAVSESLVVNTAADIRGGILSINATMTVAGGDTALDQEVFALNRWAVTNYPLPWHAGSKAIPLAATFNVGGFPSLTRQATFLLYDQDMREVGCLQYTATLTAPSSASTSPSADKPLFRMIDNIAAARHQQPVH